jgi:hypothetical protein
MATKTILDIETYSITQTDEVGIGTSAAVAARMRASSMINL